MADGFKGYWAVDDWAWGLKVKTWCEGGARASGQTSSWVAGYPRGGAHLVCTDGAWDFFFEVP